MALDLAYGQQVGATDPYATPEELKRRATFAQQLMMQAGDASPIKSAWQGVARVSSGILGALMDKEERDQLKAGNQAGTNLGLAALLGGDASPAAAAAPRAGASGDTPSSSPVNLANNDGAKTVFDGLVSRGMSPILAAGFAGNFHGESGFDPSIWGDKGTSLGIGQWRGDRLANLRAYAASQGKDPTDINVQLDHVVNEARGPEARAYQIASQARTPEEAAALLAKHYERPADWALAKSLPGRQGAARSIFDRFGGRRADAGGPSPIQLASVQPDTMNDASPAAAQMAGLPPPSAPISSPAAQPAPMTPPGSLPIFAMRRPGLDPNGGEAPQGIASAGGQFPILARQPMPLPTADQGMAAMTGRAPPVPSPMPGPAQQVPAPLPPPRPADLTPAQPLNVFARPPVSEAMGDRAAMMDVARSAPPFSFFGARPQMAAAGQPAAPQAAPPAVPAPTSPFVPRAAVAAPAPVLAPSGAGPVVPADTGATGAPAPSQAQPQASAAGMQPTPQEYAALRSPFVDAQTKALIIGNIKQRFEKSQPQPVVNESRIIDQRTGRVISELPQTEAQRVALAKSKAELVAEEQKAKGFHPLTTPEERLQYGVPPDYKGAVQVGPNNQVYFPGKADTEVNLPAGEKASEKAFGEIEGKALGHVMEAGSNASKRIQQLNLMEEAYRQGGDNIRSGPFAQTLLRGKQAIKDVFGIDMEGMSEAEVVQKVGFGLATEAVRAISARPTQMEFGKALENNPGLLMSNKGAQFMISIMRQQAQQDRDLGRLVRDSKNRTNWSEVEEKYYSEHPIVSPFSGKPVGADDIKTLQTEAAASGPPASPAVTATPDAAAPPAGVDPNVWKYMTPQERSLWRK